MSSDYNLKCRTCLNETNTYYKSIDDVEECYNIADMLDSIVPHINIRSSTQYSTLVCEICVEKLVNSYTFQQMCIESNNILENISSITIVKNEEVGENGSDPLTIEAEKNTEKNEGTLIEQRTNTCDKEVDLEKKTFQNIRLFHCKYCPKVFEKQSSLAAHFRAHKKKELVKKKSKIVESDFNDCMQMPITLQENDEAEYITENHEGAVGKLDEEINSYHISFPDNDDSNCGISQAELPVNKLGTGNCNKEDVGTEEKTLRNVQTFQCKFCPKTFEKKQSLSAHYRVHKKKELLKNNRKTVESNFNSSLDMSITLQDEEADYKIDFNSIIKEDIDSALEIHNESSNDDLSHYLVIENQESKFTVSGNTELREIGNSNRNTKKRELPCKICGKIFDRPYGLKRHKNKVHFLGGDGPHKCKVCKKIFTTSNDLEHHELVHKSSLCPHCGKTLLGKNSLRSHVERCEGLKKYECPDCPKRFNCKADLIHHSETHSNEKPHSCDICGTRFTRNYSMLKHKQLVHVGERAFKCDQCNMTFKQAHSLKRHMFTHTGEKPYKCTYCECAYAQSGDLIKHLRTHIGVNTYKCDQCSESFKYQAELRHHKSQHYKMEQKKEQTMSEEA